MQLAGDGMAGKLYVPIDRKEFSQQAIVLDSATLEPGTTVVYLDGSADPMTDREGTTLHVVNGKDVLFAEGST